MKDSNRHPVLTQLRRQWFVLSIILFGVLLLLSCLLMAFLGLLFAVTWLLPAAVLAGVQLAEIRRFLPQNHRPDDHVLFGQLGAANILTIIRGFLFVCVGGFLLAPPPAGGFRWIPGLLYTIGVVLDRFDGTLARKTGQVTVLGAQIDMRFDALGILIVTLLGLQWGMLPGWYISVGIAFYLYDIGLRFRRRRHKPVYALPENPNRPVLAGLQMGFLAVSLWPVFSPAVLRTAAPVFGLPLVITFVRDWLFASGRLDSEFVWYRRLIHLAGKTSRNVILPGIRLGAVSLVLLGITGSADGLGLQAALAKSPGILYLPGMVAGSLALCALMLVVGILPRIAALGAMVISGIWIMATPALLLPKLLLLGAGVCLVFGPGRWNLWNGEERLLMRTRAFEPTQDT